MHAGRPPPVCRSGTRRSGGSDDRSSTGPAGAALRSALGTSCNILTAVRRRSAAGRSPPLRLWPVSSPRRPPRTRSSAPACRARCSIRAAPASPARPSSSPTRRPVCRARPSRATRASTASTSLAPGSYPAITAEMAGFKKKALENVEVRAEEVQGVNIGLEAGEVTETVTVSPPRRASRPRTRTWPVRCRRRGPSVAPVRPGPVRAGSPDAGRLRARGAGRHRHFRGPSEPRRAGRFEPVDFPRPRIRFR